MSALNTLLDRPARAFLLLYLISLTVCLTMGLLHGFRASPLQLDVDEGEYFTLATQIMDGTIELSARRSLGFPVVIAAIRSIYDNILFLQGIVTALYAFSAPLLFLVVRRISRSDAAGLLAGAALAMWPPAIFYGASLYSETLAAPIFLLSLLMLPVGARLSGAAVRWHWTALPSGLLLAAATHVRPMYLLFVPFVALILWIEEASLWRALRSFALVMAGFLLLILPWSVAQTRHFHHPILVTVNGGETLAGGLNPNLLDKDFDMKTPSGRATWAGAGKWVAPYLTGFLSPAEQALPYHQQDRILRERTVDWALSHPGQAALIELRKFSYMWGIYPIAQNGVRQMLFGNLPTLALLALALWSMIVMPGSRWQLVRFWALPLFVTGVAMISWGSWRFRQPGDAGLIALAAIGIVRYQAARLATRRVLAEHSA